MLFAVLGTAMLGIAGCTCCSQVPVSLEGINNWFLYHGRACRHYPHSCPPCPYIDGQATAGEEIVEPASGAEQGTRPESGATTPSSKPRDSGQRTY